jgi:hypothetical protein
LEEELVVALDELLVFEQGGVGVNERLLQSCRR